MTNSTDLIQLYILLSYEKLQRSTISQHQRPIEASLRTRLLVWRFLKQIENEPVPTINTEPIDNQNYSTPDDNNNNSWILDLNTNYDTDNEIDMDIESDLVNNSTCETINMDQTTDVTFYLKRAIGAERRQKSSTDNFHFNDSNNIHPHQISETNTFEETEQLFHDLCAELTNTTANTLNFSTTPEQTLIH